jgi:hypothetical protein
MKNIFFIPFFFVITNVFSQKYTLKTHPLHSDVWTTVYVDSVSEFKPKDYKTFSFDLSYLNANINPVKIQDYLLQSFNEFRMDYGVHSVKENQLLTNNCITYSKQILVKFTHGPRLSDRFTEAIVILPFNMLSRISDKDGDINKVIADCCFDIFVGSPAHMEILLKEDLGREYGFGITVTNNSISIVVQSDIK